jgi:hypothetical protein
MSSPATNEIFVIVHQDETTSKESWLGYYISLT